jgi:hypothetical protein
MTWFTANVTLTNGQQKVDWNSGDPLSKLSAGDGLIVNGGTPLEILSVGSVDFLLKTAWASSTVTASVTAQPLPGDFASATENLREVSTFASSLYGQLTNFAAAQTSYVTVTDAAGVDYSVPTPKILTDAIAGLGTAAPLDVTTSATDVTNGRLLKVADGGFMTISQPTTEVSAAATQQPTSFMRDGDGSAFGFAASVLNMRFNSSRQGQLALSHGGGVSRMAFRTMISNDTWDGVKEVYHSGNSVNPLDFGLGTQSALISGLDANDAIESGFYRLTSSNTNAAFTGTATLIVTRSSNVVSQIQTDGTKIWFRRSTDTGATFSAWKELYHSGNTNFNVFGGIAANDKIAGGFARSATVAEFSFDAYGTVAATFTQTGTFNVSTPAGVSRATGITLTIDATKTTNKLLVVTAPITGGTTPNALNLITVSATDKVTVNG